MNKIYTLTKDGGVVSYTTLRGAVNAGFPDAPGSLYFNIRRCLIKEGQYANGEIIITSIPLKRNKKN